MSAPRPLPIFTVDQYLVYERQSEDRHEYLDGEILGMPSESWNHGIISTNTCVSVGVQTRGTPFVTLTKGAKIRSGPRSMNGESTGGLFSYPDVLVAPEEPEFHDVVTDIILDPIVVLEVLSPATEAFDRAIKFTRYRTWNPTLQDYILISQIEPKIEHHQRQSDGSWMMREYVGLEASFAIPSIRCTLRSADVYDRIKWTLE
jgi:Uma2 family endonuclease